MNHERVPTRKERRNLLWLLYVALGLLGVWLMLRFVFPWLAPFLFALLMARFIEPCVLWLAKRTGWRRGICAVLCSLLALAIGFLFIGFLISRLIGAMGAFAEDLPNLMGQAAETLSWMERSFNRYVAAAPMETQAMIQTVIDGIAAMADELPGRMSTYLFNSATTIASAFPRIIFVVLTYIIALVFISASYPQIMGFIARQIPPKWRERGQEFRQGFTKTLGKWLKAQGILILVAFVLLAIAFFILGVRHWYLVAFLVALIDALPVLGVGTVLIPWAMISLITGDFAHAVGLIVTYGVVSLTHHILGARLVGAQLGLHPVATLIAMYIGFSAAGVLGLLVFPFLLLFVKKCHDEGLLKLWK